MLLSAILLSFAGCTPRSAASNEARREAPGTAGWSLNGTPIGPEPSIAISESIGTVELAVVLPAGFAASDGFIQRATVSAPDYFREYELPTLDGSTQIAVPPVPELVLTLSLGFCRIDTKDICYLDWTELSVSRDPALERTGNVELKYLPEDPS